VWGDKLRREAGQREPLQMHNSLDLGKKDIHSDHAITPDKSNSTNHVYHTRKLSLPVESTLSTPARDAQVDQPRGKPLFLNPSPPKSSTAGADQEFAVSGREVAEEVGMARFTSPTWDDGALGHFDFDGELELEEQIFPELLERPARPARPSPTLTDDQRPVPARFHHQYKAELEPLVLSPTPEPQTKRIPSVSSVSSGSPQLGPALQPDHHQTPTPTPSSSPSPSPPPQPQPPPLSLSTLRTLVEHSDEDELRLAKFDVLCAPRPRIAPPKPGEGYRSTDVSKALAQEADEMVRPKKRVRVRTGTSEAKAAALEGYRMKRSKGSSASLKPSSGSGTKASGANEAKAGSMAQSSKMEGNEDIKQRKGKGMVMAMARVFVDVEAEVNEDKSVEMDADEIGDEGDER